MGIYGALATAVTGLSAQSFALENISGNIANSQTTGFKRMETGFIDLIPDASVGRQSPGAVIGYSRSTNDVRGDIITSATSTHVALNGSGFFAVAEKSGTTDGASVFGDANFFTRRGDFDLDREGYLVNGSGYYLKGVPVDGSTGNVAGSVPEMVQVSNGLIPARSTQRVDYGLNLPAVPAVGLLDAPASTSTNTGAVAGGDPLSGFPDFVANDTFTLDTGDGVETFTEGVDGTTVQDLINWINGNANLNATASIAGGDLLIEADDVQTGLTVGGTGELPGVSSQSVPEFLEQTVEGGAITVYAPNGASANVQMRWGKTEDSPDTWQIFYMSNSDPETWTEVPDGEFAFNNDGTLAAVGGNAVTPGDGISLPIAGLTINGTLIGDVELDFGETGISQYDNANGRASISTLEQDGYPAGSFMSVAINDAGRVVATYSNGEQVELYQLVTATFNAENMLKRMDGGLYAATAESGEAIISTEGSMTGGALENSNTDISEEFTKLIVTQQAYAAGTRIVTTSDEMLQEALNMVR